MAKVKVKAPSDTYNGVTAGVRFENGVGEFDPSRQVAAARYFERHGYEFRGAKAVEVEEQGTQAPVIGAEGDGGSAAGVEGIENRDAALGGDPGEGQITGELLAESETANGGKTGAEIAGEPVPAEVVEQQTGKSGAKK